jgi:pyruvate/2-oxoglutarate dehydrogenase complex dihydrolipoamide acyltransferase (E2) component
MEFQVLMPQMGESVTEGIISKWLVKEGDYVKKDQPILEISTDKVDSEVPAPEEGYVSKILFTEGSKVPVKTVIAIITKEKVQTTGLTQEVVDKASLSSQSGTQSTEDKSGKKSFISPIVKKMAEEEGLTEEDLSKVQGSGAGGRITKDDIREFIAKRRLDKNKVEVRSEVSQGVKSSASSHSSSLRGEDLEVSPELAQKLLDNEYTIEPMSTMRRLIAEHMVRSKATSPHVYSIQEVDVTNIVKYRERWKEEFQKREGFSLSFTPFFLEAAVKAILEYPLLNSSVDGTNIILKKHIHLGVAVALGNTGLIVPVIKRAEEKSLVGLARALNDLASRARAKKLSPDEVAGGTFSVTNPGVFGTLIGTPIINQPQVAILCLGAITKRPAVVDGDKIGIRDLIYLTLSYDHRVIDGALAGQFLSFIRNYLESWDLQRNLFA